MRIESPVLRHRALPFRRSRLAPWFALLLLFACGPAWAKEPALVAVFPFDFVNSSLEATRPEERRRLRMLREQLARGLEAHGYRVIDASAAAASAPYARLRDCNGCERDLARALGADLAAIGWVQKVSNLILSITVQTSDGASGRVDRGGFVSIRGNTDESWSRGLAYLLERVLFRDPENGR